MALSFSQLNQFSQLKKNRSFCRAIVKCALNLQIALVGGGVGLLGLDSAQASDKGVTEPKEVSPKSKTSGSGEVGQLAVFGTAPLRPRVYTRFAPNQFWSGPDIVIDGKVEKLSDVTLSEALKSNPRAAELAAKYEDYQFWGTTSVLLGFGGAVGYALTTRPFDSGVYWAIFGAGLITGSVFNVYAASFFLKSINVYNGVEESQATLDFNLVPLADGGGGQLRLTF